MDYNIFLVRKMQYELIRLPVGFNVNSLVNIAIGQDLISLKGFTYHGIAIDVYKSQTIPPTKRI